MGLTIGRSDYCVVSCGDPHGRGCTSHTEEMSGQIETANAARKAGWLKYSSTGMWVCSPCYYGGPHDVVVDTAGFSSRPRLTCNTPVCRFDSLVDQPYLTQEAWERKRARFLERHPSSVK